MIIVLKRHNGTPNTAPFFHAKKIYETYVYCCDIMQH